MCHWLLQCSAWDHLRQLLLEAMDEVREDFSTKNDGDRTALILSHACLNYHILSIIPLCGRLGFINAYALFMLTNNL